MMWMGSWGDDLPGGKGRWKVCFGVTEGSMSYGLKEMARRTNKSGRAADVSDSRRECHQQQPDRRRKWTISTKSVGRFFPEDYHALKGSVTTKTMP